MDTIYIRRVGMDEIDILLAISRQTFLAAFAAGNTQENLQLYVSTSFTKEKLSQELCDPHSAFYFALLHDQVVGYLKVNTGLAQTERNDDQALEIERIYVTAPFQGMNVGKQLMGKAMELARLHKAPYVWLGVWEENHRAITFYRNNGFEEFDRHVFHLGNDVQTDIMMKRALVYPATE